MIQKICKRLYFNPAALLNMVGEAVDVSYLMAHGGIGLNKPRANN